MPSLLRTVRQALLALAVALLGLAAWSAPASAAFPGIEISITAPEGDSQQILLSEIGSPDIEGRYWFPGEAQSTDVAKGNGISLYEVLAATRTADGYRAIRVEGPGGEFTITSGQVRNPNLPPFFYLDPTGQVHFVVPTDGPSADDPNGYFPISSSAFSMTQVGGEVTVRVKASRTEIEPGESVTFTANASPSDSYRYNWTFESGVGRKNAGTKVTHRFKKAGRYRVAVGVYLGDDPSSLGGAGVVVQVGDPKGSDQDRDGGGDNGAANAPDTGASTGTGTGTGGYTPSYTPSTPTAPTAPSTPPPPSTPSAEPPLTPDLPTSSGTTVEGNLLADVSDPPPTSILESAARAAREGKRSDESADGAGVSEAAISIAGVLALLALGAGIETRQGRLPRWRLPRPSLPRRAA